VEWLDWISSCGIELVYDEFRPYKATLHWGGYHVLTGAENFQHHRGVVDRKGNFRFDPTRGSTTGNHPVLCDKIIDINLPIERLEAFKGRIIYLKKIVSVDDPIVEVKKSTSCVE
jgi:hypothetical protein